MIIYIYGEDTFRSRKYLEQSVERFKKERDPQGLNVVFLDGQSKDVGRVWTEITASPFLAEKKMIVIKNILSSKDEESIMSLAEGIDAGKIPENNIIIFWQSEPLSKLKVASKLEKRLQKEKWAVEFGIYDQQKIIAWITEEIKNRGAKISKAAIDYLAINSAGDLWYLNTIIDQLVAFSNQEEITSKMAQVFLEEKIDDSIFSLVDSVVSGNQKLAYKLLLNQRKIGEADSYIFAMILRQFRILIQIRSLLDREPNLTSDKIAAELGVHPFVAKKSLPIVKRYSFEKLSNIYSSLLDIDTKTKTGQGDQSLFIDIFIAKGV